MSEFCYTTVPGKVKALFGKIREVGVPRKVTVQWLKTLGFTSSNDSTLIGVLKQVDLIDSSNAPTARWTQYRGAHHGAVLGEAIAHGYAELYAVYPDAQQRPQTDLDHVFSTHSSGGKQVIGKTISTFKALVELADFSQVGQTAASQSTLAATPAQVPVPLPAPLASPTTVAPAAAPSGPNLHIDIQVHISPEATPEQIEKVFESMARHLYGAKKSGK